MTEREFQSPVHLPLANGWLLSIAQDLSGVGHSVAAWPTDDPDLEPAVDWRWFPFQHGGIERRVFDIDELMAVAREVAAASSPAPLPETDSHPRPGLSVTAALINGGPADASPALGAAVVFPSKDEGRVGR